MIVSYDTSRYFGIEDKQKVLNLFSIPTKVYRIGLLSQTAIATLFQVLESTSRVQQLTVSQSLQDGGL